MYLKEVELYEYYINHFKNQTMKTQTINEVVEDRNVQVVTRILNNHLHEEKYGEIYDKIYEAKSMLNYLSKQFPLSKSTCIIYVNIATVRELSDIAHNLCMGIKETEDGCFVSELIYEAGKIILKTN